MPVITPPFRPYFGSGNPSFPVPDGSIYFDTSLNPFAEWTYFGGMWNNVNPGGGGADATLIQGVPIDPTAPNTGDILQYNGADWAPAPPPNQPSILSPFYDPNVAALVTPAASGFTTVNSTATNHGTATLVDLVSRGVSHNNILANSGVATQGFSFAAPAGGTFSQIDCFIQATFNELSNWFMGVGLRDTANKIQAFGWRMGGLVWSDFRYTDIDTFSTGINAQVYQKFSCAWIRIVKTSGNFIFSVSLDGETYIQQTSVSATVFLGASLNGIGLFSVNNTGSTVVPVRFNCFSLKVTP